MDSRMKRGPRCAGQRLEITALALLLFFPFANAAEHKVSTPADIAAAAKTAAPGDVLLMADGTWRDAKIVFQAEGTSAQPITLRAESPGRVVLTGESWLRMAGKHLVVDGLRFENCNSTRDVMEFRADSKRLAHQCRLTNCAFVDCNPPDGETNTRWISIYGVGNRVDHCYVRGKANVGATLVVWLAEESPHHLIDHNHFAPRPRLKVNGGETIRVGDSTKARIAARCLVESNLFEACNGEAEIISNKSRENVYRRNTFLACEGALTLRVGSGCLVEGNFFLGNHKRLTGGVRVIDEDQRVINNYFAELDGEGTRAALCLMNGIPDSSPAGYYRVKRAVVAFNTFVDCKESMVIGYVYHDASLPPEDCVFANNLVVGARGPFVRQITAPERATWLGNIMFGAAPGLPEQPGVIRVDPKLARGPDGLWRPDPNSPVRGAASDEFPLVRVDRDGQPRVGRKDIGCDQLADGAISSRPLAPDDVGPAWMRGGQP